MYNRTLSDPLFHIFNHLYYIPDGTDGAEACLWLRAKGSGLRAGGESTGLGARCTVVSKSSANRTGLLRLGSSL